MVQRGSDIDGEAVGRSCGYSVSLIVMALKKIGATWMMVTMVAIVVMRVYKWNNIDRIWVQRVKIYMEKHLMIGVVIQCHWVVMEV